MKTCDKPEWRECPDAIRVSGGDDILLILVECHAEGLCPFEEEDDAM